ncbi:4Fe-4S binding protein [candidate division KSB1 bacterium]|nr:4Fe-4S binding protein [candidate division KSB1 bacterium]
MKEKKIPKIEVNTGWCKGCGICVEFCPKDVLALNGSVVEVVHLEQCISCKLCEIRCPDFAITVLTEDD